MRYVMFFFWCFAGLLFSSVSLPEASLAEAKSSKAKKYFEEDFETGTGPFVTNPNGDATLESSADVSISGEKSAKISCVERPNPCYAEWRLQDLNIRSAVVSIWFYDSMNFSTYEGVYVEDFLNTGDMFVSTAEGSDVYYCGNQNYAPTNVKRIHGWHKITFDLRKSPGVTYFDGKKMCENPRVSGGVRVIAWGSEVRAENYLFSTPVYVDDLRIIYSDNKP